MLWKMWAAIGAIVIGFLVPTLSGERVPPRAMLILLAALLAGVAATAFAVVSNGRAKQRKTEVATLRAERSATQTDRQFVDQIAQLIRTREIDWLLTESFAGSWWDDHSSHLREVVLFDASHNRILDPELGRAVNRLTNAAGIFIRIYDSSTTADSMMRDATWRTIGRMAPDGGTDLLTSKDRLSLQARLRAAAAEVCESNDALLLILNLRFRPL